MAGLNDTDIRLDSEMQISIAANADAALITEFECLKQDIEIEALAQEKDLFYDEEYGWSLLDFIQAEDNELTRIEIKQRILTKLSKRKEVNIDTVKVDMFNKEDKLLIDVKFTCMNYHAIELKLALDRVKVEVVVV